MFKASLGTTVKIATVISVGLLLLISFGMIFIFIVGLLSNEYEKKDFMLPIVAISIFSILYYAFTEHIAGYEVLADGIKIIKSNSSKFIRKDSIVEINLINSKDIRYSIRTFGIGGVFSISGSFTNKKFGQMTWYLTRKDRIVMISTKYDKILLSPDEPELFLKKVSETIK